MLVFLISYVCSVLFSFLYHLTNTNSLNLNYLVRRSKCDHCGRKLGWFELVPIFSFFILKGKSHCCNQKLKRHYIFGECFAFLIIPLIINFDTNVHFSLFITTYLFLLTMALYDLQTLTINIVMIILYTIVCAKITMIYFSTFIFFTLIFHLYYFLFPRQIGYGDILLLSILSCFFPYRFYLIFLLYTLLIAIIVSSILLIMKQQTYIPFVPFMFIGFIMTNYLYQNTLLYI
ncbi:prepilin peptidase [Staphylococcus haemolyticus]|uniref:prepilin peptidase n=1 Tax=Staphylococcus haemolyticus TaxID=1283 RepID=UPI0035E430EC